MTSIPVYNPVAPFLGRIIGGWHQGLLIRIRGKIHGHDQRCNIDFVNTPSLSTNQDIIFHVSVRPNENAIVRNHFHNGKWGVEERDGPCTRANESFELIITAERDYYKLTINGVYLGSYRHHLPLNLVQYINISGKVSIDHILIEQDISHMNVTPYPSPIDINQHSSPSAPPYFPSPMVPMQIGVNQHSSPSVPPYFPSPMQPMQIGINQHSTPSVPQPYFPQHVPTPMNLSYPSNYQEKRY